MTNWKTVPLMTLKVTGKMEDNLVKVRFPALAERMWVEVTNKSSKYWTGILQNNSVHGKLKMGDTVKFLPHWDDNQNCLLGGPK